MHIAIPDGKVSSGQRKRDRLAFPWLEVYTLKTAQIFFIGRDAADELPRVQLHNLVSGSRTSVLHINVDQPDCATGSEAELANIQIAVRESRITQAVPEIIKRPIDARLLASIARLVWWEN